MSAVSYDPFALGVPEEEVRQFLGLKSVLRPMTETAGVLIIHDEDGAPEELDFERHGPTRGRMSKLNPSTRDDTITILHCRKNRRSAKVINVEPESCSADPSTWRYQVDDYDAGRVFTRLVEVEISNIRELAYWLAVIAQDPRNLLIRGEPLPDAEPPILRRAVGAKEHAAFHDRPGGKRWAMIDIDEAKLVGDFDLVKDPESAVRAALAHLPDYFQRGTCLWQLSSTAWLKGVRLHLFFWFDRGVTDDELVVALEGYPVDRSVFRTVQPHYITNPIFQGAPDPLPRRWGLLAGEADEVTFPEVDTSKRQRSARVDVDADTKRANNIPIQDVAVWLELMPNGADSAPRCPGYAPDQVKGDHYGVHFHLNGIKCPHDRCEGLGNGRGFRSCVALVAEVRDVSEAEAVRLLLEQFDPPPKVELEQLAELARKLKKSNDHRTATLGTQLAKLCKREAMPLDVIERIANLVGEKFYDCDPKALARHFEPSASSSSDDISKQIEAAQQSAKAKRAKENQDWAQGLVLSVEGVRKPSLGNTLHVLARHPDWHGVLAWDEFAEGVTKVKLPPIRPQDAGAKQELGDWTDDDTNRCVSWLGSLAGFEPTRQHVEEAVRTVAKKKMVHPVRDYLDALEWDGVARLDYVLPRYFGTDDTPYTRKIGSCWMKSAVARVYEPGCQADCMLVLEGRQGGRKSTGLEALAGGTTWFADTGIQIGTKDSYQSLRRKWIYEFGELDSLKRSEVTKIKNFLSARSDYYRESYGHRSRDFPRQCIFAGSTNDDHYLVDMTGNRRFWPARCVRDVDIEAIRRDRDQLWAEARVRYERGELWYIAEPDLIALAEAEQAAREAPEEWIPIIESWLNKTDTDLTKGIGTNDLLEFAIDVPKKDRQPWHSVRVGRVLKALGWSRRQVREGTAREWRYFAPDGWAQPPDALRDSRRRAMGRMFS